MTLRKAIKACAIITLWGICASVPMSLSAENMPIPFAPGEKLIFEIRWSLIPAGTAELEVLPFETINGTMACHLVMTARTNEFVDYFYKVRDRIDAYVDMDVTRSVLYKKKQREGRSKRDILVEFDWVKMEVQYSDAGKKRAPIPIQPGTFDPFSAFYFTRRFDWNTETEVQRPVTDGKKNIIGRARLIRREKIQVPAGVFDTILYEPDIEHIGGVFEKSPDAKIELWLTDDRRRIPVRLKSKVIVGSFVAELVSMKGVGLP